MLNPQPPNTWMYYTPNGSIGCSLYVPIGHTVLNTAQNYGGTGVTIALSDQHNNHYSSVVPPGVIDWIIQPPWTNAPGAAAPVIAHNADELRDDELILTLIARGYAVWKPPVGQ